MKVLRNLIPIQASTFASHVDDITLGLLILSALIVILIFGLMIVFGILYREKSERSRVIEFKHDTLLEWGWTVAISIVFLGIFAWGAVEFMDFHVPPSDAVEIMVVGKQWMWKFQHAGGQREINDLHIPVGQAILLTMTSEDVIHSFFVPDFRVKQDVLPGRYSRLWFKATRVGQYHLFCTQYCGTMHAQMRGTIYVMPEADYQKWLQTGLESGSAVNSEGGENSLDMKSRGERLFTRLGCVSCHGLNPGVKAPALQGIFGRPVGLSDGTSVIADENYLRESIVNPGAKIVQGYQNLMPSFAGLISEEDILDLIAFVKSLKDTPQAEAPQGPRADAAVPSPPPLKKGGG